MEPVRQLSGAGRDIQLHRAHSFLYSVIRSFCLEMRAHHIAQASLEFTAVFQPQPHSTRITGTEPPLPRFSCWIYHILGSQSLLTQGGAFRFGKNVRDLCGHTALHTTFPVPLGAFTQFPSDVLHAFFIPSSAERSLPEPEIPRVRSSRAGIWIYKYKGPRRRSQRLCRGNTGNCSDSLGYRSRLCNSTCSFYRP